MQISFTNFILFSTAVSATAVLIQSVHGEREHPYMVACPPRLQPHPIPATHPLPYHPLPHPYHPPTPTLYHPPTPTLYHPPTPTLHPPTLYTTHLPPPHHPPIPTTHPTLYHLLTTILSRVGVDRGSKIWVQSRYLSQTKLQALSPLETVVSVDKRSQIQDGRWKSGRFYFRWLNCWKSG